MAPQRKETLSGRPTFAGLRRYRCNSYAPTINEASQSLGLNHKKSRLYFGASLSKGEVINVSVERCGATVVTAFRWRHRFVKAVGMASDKLKNIVKAGEHIISEEPKEVPLRRQNHQVVNATKTDSGFTHRRSNARCLPPPRRQQSARPTEEFTFQLSRYLNQALQTLPELMLPQHQTHGNLGLCNASNYYKYIRSCKLIPIFKHVT